MRFLSDYLRESFGEKVYRLSLSSGCTCPNRDGFLSVGGCTFCSEGGSGEFAAEGTLEEQISRAKELIARKTGAKKFIAYYQSFTNTYGDVKRLEKLYTDTIRRPEIAVLSLGTRPDCLGEEVMGMLKRLNAVKPVWIELGLQTIHETTAQRINRRYSLAVFEDAYRRLRRAGITVIVHVIFSLPGESREDMKETIRYLSALEPELQGIKIAMLNILKNTPMYEEYQRRPFRLLTMEEYTDLVAECMSILPKNTVVHRISGDGARKLLVAPEWITDKKRVMNMIRAKMARQG